MVLYPFFDVSIKRRKSCLLYAHFYSEKPHSNWPWIDSNEIRFQPFIGRHIHPRDTVFFCIFRQLFRIFFISLLDSLFFCFSFYYFFLLQLVNNKFCYKKPKRNKKTYFFNVLISSFFGCVSRMNREGWVVGTADL